MRLALLTDGLWPDSIGGMQKHSYYMAKYLSLNGILVDLFYCANDPKSVTDLFSFDEALNIRFFHVEFPENFTGFPGQYVLNSYLFSKALYKVYREQPVYDFTYAQGFTGWYFVRQGVKIGSNLHGLEMYQKAFGLKSKIIQYLLRIPAGTIIRGSYINFSLGGKLTGILKQKGAVIIKETPIGIGSEWLKRNEISNKKIQFTFIGRNEKRKGLDILFEVIKNLDPEKYSFQFIGISKPDREVPDALVFHGEIRDGKTIQQILAQSDVLVCPSIAEGMPTVILEAMGMGLAIIATDTGATSLLVDENNGMLIPPGDRSELLRALRQFIGIAPSRLRQLKDHSFEKVSNEFIWEVSIKTTINALSAHN